MRYVFYIVAFSLCFTLVTCEYIDIPVPAISGHGDTASCPKPTFPKATSALRNVLIEKYTGQDCNNCPRASDTLKNLIKDFPNRVIGVSVYYGSNANPNSPLSSKKYKYDFRVDAGNIYGDFFIKLQGLPTGLISRKNYSPTGTQHRVSDVIPPTWRDNAIEIMGKPAIADIKMINNYNGGDSLCVNVRTTFLQNTSGTYKLVILLTQDSIIDWQKKQSSEVPEYVHKHVLRTSITPPWGNTMASGNIANNYYVDERYKIQIKPSYNNVPCKAEHCHIVAFLYDANTYEVMQVVEEKVK